MAYINAATAAGGAAASLADDHRAQLHYEAATHRLDQAGHRQFASAAAASLETAETHKEADCLRASTAAANANVDDVVVNDSDAAAAAAQAQAQTEAHQAAGM